MIVYLWLVFFGLPHALLGFSLESTYGNNTVFVWRWDLGVAYGIVGPLALYLAIRGASLIKFHALQAVYLFAGYVIVRTVLQLLYLIPAQGFQDVLLDQAIVPAVQAGFAFLAVFLGAKALVNKELYPIPFVGNFIPKPSAGQPPVFGSK